MIWLAVDYGKKRIGFASSGSSGVAVTPQGILPYPEGPWIKKESFALVATRLHTLAAELGGGLEGIVLGDPGLDDPGSGYLRTTILQLRDHLTEIFFCPIHLQDERFSSREAAERLGRTGAKGPLDEVAAAVILERFFRANNP